MTSMSRFAAFAAALALLAACGEDRGADGLTAEERRKLDEHAANLDGGADVVDASPDSLVATNESESVAADNAVGNTGQ